MRDSNTNTENTSVEGQSGTLPNDHPTWRSRERIERVTRDELARLRTDGGERDVPAIETDADKEIREAARAQLDVVLRDLAGEADAPTPNTSLAETVRDVVRDRLETILDNEVPRSGLHSAVKVLNGDPDVTINDLRKTAGFPARGEA